MKVMIIAQEKDNHTIPVKWALERAGYAVRCWAGLGWSPERQASVSLSRQARLTLGSSQLEPGDVVWIRRPEPPSLNADVAEADKKFARGEYRWFSDAVLYLLELLPVRCINKYSASRFIRNKSAQLLLAQNCGLNIPSTLMSNAPPAVRDYLQHDSTRSICKPFFPHMWQITDKKSVAVTETFEITGDMLPSDEVLTYAPAIYQQLIAKQFDVRMVLMGTSVYSYALYNPKEALDWRQDVTQGIVRVESIDTPPEIRREVLAFAEKSGIAFGSFDFAVDREGGWWFLEVNEQGQFLWLDEFNPNIHVQEKFLAFLTSPEGAPQQVLEQRQSLFPSWKDYLDSSAANQETAEQAHIIPEFMSLE